MKLFGVTLWGTVLLCGAIALSPQRHAPSAALAEPTLMVAQAKPRAERTAVLRAPLERRVRALDSKTVERCLEVMGEIDPARAETLERIRASQSAEAFAAALADKHYLLSLAALKDQDTRLYHIRIDELRLDATIETVTNQLIEARRASSPSAADLEAQLHELAKQKVGFSLVARGEYHKRLTDRLKELEVELDREARPENFLPAVERQFKEMLERAEAAAAQAPGS